MHAISFSLCMVSTIVFIAALGLFSLSSDLLDYYFMADIFNIVGSSATQALICYIFWNIENIREGGIETRDDVHGEEIDEDTVLQMRHWHQLMATKVIDLPSFYPL